MLPLAIIKRFRPLDARNTISLALYVCVISHHPSHLKVTYSKNVTVDIYVCRCVQNPINKEFQFTSGMLGYANLGRLYHALSICVFALP